MIITRNGSATTGVPQPEHARNSGLIAEAWDLKRAAGIDDAERPRFIEATAHHDDGWIEWERRELEAEPEELPPDFADADADDRVAVWRRSVGLAAERHPYVGLLVAMHARFLFARSDEHDDLDADEARAIHSFEAWLDGRIAELHEQALTRDSGEALTSLTQSDAQRRQSWLSLFDALTLMMLEGIPRRERIEIDDAAVQLEWAPDRHTVKVTPWMMAPERDRIELSFETIDGAAIEWSVERATSSN